MENNIISELEWRGLVLDCTDKERISKLPKGSTFYGGFDPTAPSLQFGNLVQVFTIARLEKLGYKAIGLFGGATGAIGDPKDTSERSLLSKEQIEFNITNQIKKVKEVYERIGANIEFVNNYDWFSNIYFLDFLRDIGKYITVNYMISKDVVKRRLEKEDSSISYAEFSYMLLQAYDYYHLNKEKNCVLQVGGSDQWGNMTAGIEYIRKKEGKSVDVLTFPLLTDSTGRKLGKSEGNTIWIDENYTSPYQFHQYLLNTEDESVIRILKFLTFLPKEEIDELENSLKTSPEKREAQKRLADELTTMIHGADKMELAKRSASVLFGGSIDGIAENDLISIFKDVPSSSLEKEKIFSKTVLDIFCDTGLCSSKGEVKRLIQNGGAYINNQKINNVDFNLNDLSIKFNNILLLRSGKKNYHLVKF